MKKKRIGFNDLLLKKEQEEKISMLTAYDWPMARLLDKAGIDCVLVGDSAANTVLGYEDTVPVTMDEMIVLARAVSRGVDHALVIGDMPFLSYQVSVEEAIRNGGRFLKEAQCDAVKLEGGAAMVPTIAAMTRAGIPVVGHLGLTPQTASMLGGYRVQGRTAQAALAILEDAMAIEKAGAVMLVLELVPHQVASLVSKHLRIPVIGIGAGPGCDGQVLVLHDMLGFNDFRPKFLKVYENLEQRILEAADAYIKDVKSRSFPDADHRFTMEKQELSTLMAQVEERYGR